MKSSTITRRKLLAIAGATGAVACMPSTQAPVAEPTGGIVPTPAPTPRSGGTMRWAYYLSDIGPALNMLPATRVAGVAQAFLQYNMYDTLYRLTNESGGLIDWLAEKTEISSDGLTWTLRLRAGVKFHDGSEFDAAAVKTNIDLRKAHSTFSLKGQISSIEAVNVIDKLTVQFRLTKPSASLRSVLSAPQFGMQSPAVTARYPEAEYFRHASGTGPFKLEGSPTDVLVVMVRNPDYWGPKAYLDRVEFRTITDPAAALAALEAGDLDLTLIPGEELGRVRSEGRVAVVRTVPNFQYLFFNTSKAPFTDSRVRQAVVYGTNRTSYEALTGAAQPELTKYLVLPSFFGAASQTTYPYDPAKARQLLDAAGVQAGTPIELFMPNPFSWAPQVGQLLQSDLQKLGFDVNLTVTDTNTWIAGLSKAAAETTWHLSLTGGSLPYPDAEAFFFRFLYGPNAAPKGGNWMHYQNPKMDKLLEAQRAISDLTARKEALAEIQRIVWDDAPMASAFLNENFAGASKAVRDLDFLTTTFGGPVFHRTWLAQ